jgi:hypothetical protein
MNVGLFCFYSCTIHDTPSGLNMHCPKIYNHLTPSGSFGSWMSIFDGA